MSGILDKKSRIIDFVITNNGRSQIEDGDIRYRYATVSDKSILYIKDFEKSKISKSDISDSEFFYIPIEANTKLNDEINPEFDLSKAFSYSINNILDSRETLNSVNFDSSVDNILATQTLNSNLKNLKLITTKNSLNTDEPITFKNNGYLSDIDFKSNVNKYKTIKQYTVHKENIPVLALDKRFSHKKNFKIMIPKDITGTDLYDIDQFKNIDQLDDFNTTGYLFSSYLKKSSLLSDSVLSREKEIVITIKDLESDVSIYKKVYELENTSEDNSFIVEIHEPSFSKNNIEKLSIVKIGSFYDKDSFVTKKVYLVGKVINTRNNTEDLDTLFSFNDGKINLKNKSTFAISAYYSFLTLFTMIIE